LVLPYFVAEHSLMAPLEYQTPWFYSFCDFLIPYVLSWLEQQ